MLTNEQLSKLYDCAVTSTRLPNGFTDDEKDLDTIIRYGELFKVCKSSNSTDCIQKAEHLDELEKQRLKDIVTRKLAEATKVEEAIPWNVNIVIGNSHVAKSLRPIINIRMPNGENFEFDIDSFAQFRQQLARTVLAVNPQE